MNTHGVEHGSDIFSSSLINGILIVKQKQHIQKLAENIYALQEFNNYFMSTLSRSDYTALFVIACEEHMERLEYYSILSQSLKNYEDRKYFDRLANVTNSMLTTLSELNRITVYAAQGRISYYHLNMSLAYDYRIVAEGSVFENFNSDIGLITKGSGYYLPRLLGYQKATEFLQWKNCSAEEALHLGLVDKIIPASRFEEEAMRFVRETISTMTPTLLEIRKLYKCNMKELKRSLALEDRLIGERLDSRAFRDAFAASLAKGGQPR